MSEKAPFDLARIFEEMTRFYREVYQLVLDPTILRIPATRPPDFGWALPMIPGLTHNRIIAEMESHFKLSLYAEDLDTAIPTHDRDPSRDGPYLIFLRDRVEADEGFRDRSANQLARKGVKGITSPERLILERWYYWKTAEHLDTQNVTLCSGSRNLDGGVPCVDWSRAAVWFNVYWARPGYRDETLCTRQVVSAFA